MADIFMKRSGSFGETVFTILHSTLPDLQSIIGGKNINREGKIWLPPQAHAE